MPGGKGFCKPGNGSAGGRTVGRAGNRRRCAAAPCVAKDSEVEISMIVLWPLEAWPKFSVSYLCSMGLEKDGPQRTYCQSFRLTQLGRSTACGFTG